MGKSAWGSGPATTAALAGDNESIAVISPQCMKRLVNGLNSRFSFLFPVSFAGSWQPKSVKKKKNAFLSDFYFGRTQTRRGLDAFKPHTHGKYDG